MAERVFSWLEPGGGIALLWSDPLGRGDAAWQGAMGALFEEWMAKLEVERQFGVWDDAQQDKFFENDWAGGEFEIIECDGSPCGYVCIEDRAEDVHIREIVIDPVDQGRGIGTLIITEAVERARQRDVPVVLGTLHRNRAATLYRRIGFAEMGATETHTLFRLGRDDH